ncbi:interleukin-1 receptor-like 1 isoform X4 [Struthio camelus]|uniref:interleukin-1 receptor-like 1 isoform X4 n=1 Tax=Struthio camelus TaxID=8801 RepID=UPI0024006448
MGYVCLIFLSAFFLVSMTSESFDAMEGDALVIKCPPRSSYVRITWYHTDSNKIIPAEEDGSRIFSSKRFLWFLPTSREDSGNYTCVIHYSNNGTKEFNISVQVHPYKQGICFPSQIRYPNNTGRGKIVCPTFDNYKNATIIQWYKDCKPIQGERYFKGDKYIYINNPGKEDDGFYTCQFIYTHNGKVFNVSATRIFVSNVKYSPLPPQILFPKHKDVIEVDLGAALSLKCQARLGIKKQPIAVVTWDVNSIPVKYFDFSRFHEETVFFEGHDQEYYRETTLHITEIKKEDLQANFTCVAVNEMENTKATVTLQLKAQYGKIYDAYIIYPKSRTSEANFVENFVYQILPDVLENKYGYKLCIYGRDICPGEDTASAVEKRIQKSRRLIIIVTQQLIHHEDLAYDQHIALYNALIQNGAKVILLEMETIGTYEKLQESLKYIIKQQGTVKWKEPPTGQPQSSNSKFWKHVRYRMPLTHKTSRSANAG